MELSKREFIAKLRLVLVMLQAAGVLRMSHINDEPKASLGVVLDSSRRPDGDTLDRYLNQLIELDEIGAEDEGCESCLGCIRPDGIIAQAQQESLRAWAEADLVSDEVWRFDGHTVEYLRSGQDRQDRAYIAVGGLARNRRTFP